MKINPEHQGELDCLHRNLAKFFEQWGNHHPNITDDDDVWPVLMAEALAVQTAATLLAFDEGVPKALVWFSKRVLEIAHVMRMQDTVAASSKAVN